MKTEEKISELAELISEHGDFSVEQHNKHVLSKTQSIATHVTAFLTQHIDLYSKIS